MLAAWAADIVGDESLSFICSEVLADNIRVCALGSGQTDGLCDAMDNEATYGVSVRQEVWGGRLPMGSVWGAQLPMD